MSDIDRLFQQHRQQGRKAFMPFVTAGDPDLEFTAKVVRLLSECGCSLCELGIPYSDPIADGPVIQASYTRALEHGVRVEKILETAARCVTEQPKPMPLVTMVSYAIVHRHGAEDYVKKARQAGVSGAIIPDLLVDESEEMAAICQRHDFSLIQLVTPTTPRDRAIRIAKTSTGFLYYVSVTGITGTRRELPPEIVEQVGWLKNQTELPICIGFGISQPEHLRMLSPVADGFIVGSAIVRLIEGVAARGEQTVLAEIRQFVESMLAETRVS